jgi:hypothetical protein
LLIRLTNSQTRTLQELGLVRKGAYLAEFAEAADDVAENAAL